MKAIDAIKTYTTFNVDTVKHTACPDLYFEKCIPFCSKKNGIVDYTCESCWNQEIGDQELNSETIYKF